MSHPTSESGQAGHFIPLAALPSWTQAMHQAAGAERMGHAQQAIELYRTALALALDSLKNGADDNEDARLAAMVSSSRSLSSLQEEQGDCAQAAAAMARAHTTVMGLIQGRPMTSAWRRAAIRYSHDTHEALVNHWQTHGPDPVIERALRAGCLSINTGFHPLH